MTSKKYKWGSYKDFVSRYRPQGVIDLQKQEDEQDVIVRQHEVVEHYEEYKRGLDEI